MPRFRCRRGYRAAEYPQRASWDHLRSSQYAAWGRARNLLLLVLLLLKMFQERRIPTAWGKNAELRVRAFCVTAQVRKSCSFCFPPPRAAEFLWFGLWFCSYQFSMWSFQNGRCNAIWWSSSQHLQLIISVLSSAGWLDDSRDITLTLLTGTTSIMNMFRFLIAMTRFWIIQ